MTLKIAPTRRFKNKVTAEFELCRNARILTSEASRLQRFLIPRFFWTLSAGKCHKAGQGGVRSPLYMTTRFCKAVGPGAAGSPSAHSAGTATHSHVMCGVVVCMSPRAEGCSGLPARLAPHAD